MATADAIELAQQRISEFFEAAKRQPLAILDEEKHEKTKAEDELEQALAGNFSLRDKLGTRFGRDGENGGRSAEYRALKTHAAKRDFQKNGCPWSLARSGGRKQRPRIFARWTNRRAST